MSDTFWTSFFSNFAAILTAVGVVIGIIISALNNRRLKDVHDAVNGGWAELKAKDRSTTDALEAETAETARLKAEIITLQRIITKGER